MNLPKVTLVNYFWVVNIVRLCSWHHNQNRFHHHSIRQYCNRFLSVLFCVRIKVKHFTITNHLIPDWKIMIIHFTYLNCDPICRMSITLFLSGDCLFVFFSSLGFSFTVIKIGSHGHFKCFCSVNLSSIFWSISNPFFQNFVTFSLWWLVSSWWNVFQ